jgi:hypothetical protein
MGIMHVQADLLNNIGDVWSGERQVLEGIHQAPIGGWISNGSATSAELGLCVDGSGARFALPHTCTLEDIKDVLSL